MDNNIHQRNKQIVKLHKEGNTQQHIANTFGLTRQRIQQIEHALGLKRTRSRGGKEFELICQYSGKKFVSRNKNQKYAKREYFYLARRKYHTPEEIEASNERRREKNRQKATWYYYNVFKKRPDFSEIVRQRNKKYAVPSSN